MTDRPTCPKCGALLTAEAPEGLCPRCLLQAGIARPLEAAASGGPAATQTLAGFDPPSPTALDPLFPQLEILELLGRGGMGAVYKARQPDLDRLVAVKILPPEVGADPAFASRFSREARALARLNHQNIVAVYDFGQTSGLYYFVMEYVDGRSLRQLILGGGLEPEAALAIVPQICEALQFAHDEGIVHRDIKPENILVDKRGRVKIADFGLAKLLGQAAADPHLTAAHQVMGTPRYMAPEQMRGSQMVDHRADIYSLGVVFYEMLTGELPLGQFPLPSRRAHIDARLDQVVLRALAQEPEQRYQQVSQVKSDVESLRMNELPLTPPLREPLPAKPEPGLPVRPRFSRKAILAACWMPLFFVVVLLSVVTMRVEQRYVIRDTEPSQRTITPEGQVVEVWQGEPQMPVSRPTAAGALWHWVLIVTILPLGLAAPFGTTILGIVAIGDVRHSRGTVVGLPLAVADALFYPLLFLDALIVALIGMVSIFAVSLGARFMNPQGSHTAFLALGLVVLLSVPICIAVDTLIAYAVWRKSSREILPASGTAAR